MKQQTSHLTLATEPLDDGLLVVAEAHGILDGDDYDTLIPELDALIADGRKLSFLLILQNFHGWDAEAFWRELKWDGKNRDRLERIAIVGDRSWEKWFTTLSKWFVPGNVRYFDRTEEAAARVWIASP